MRLSLALLLAVGLGLTTADAGIFKKKKYENPITKDTQQPDKVLFDKSIKDIERGRYEIARLTLNTLINTYDTSEYLAKAKLAVADSWMREGGSHGMAQAEAEYKDFILFYPTMEEAAEAQEKVCNIHLKQMEKPDRDPKHAYRAEDECRLLLTQFPNSKFAPRVQQLLRNIQEVEAEGEMRVGRFYVSKGSNPAATNRLQGVADQYPLFSQSDEALYLLGGSYTKMGARFKPQAVAAYQRLIKDYPLSAYVPDVKKKLTTMEAEIPAADPVALARMKYEQENKVKNGMMHNFWATFKKSPDMTMAAKSGTPILTPQKPTIPVSIPVPAGVTGGVSDVGGTVLTGKTDLDTKPDARQSVQNAAAATAADPAKPEVEPAKPATEPAKTDVKGEKPAEEPQYLPSNRQPLKPQKVKKPKKVKPEQK